MSDASDAGDARATGEQRGAGAVAHVRRQVDRSSSRARLTDALGQRTAEALRSVATAGRLTVAFHPDRPGVTGATTAAGLLGAGRYRNQWETATSSGDRSAVAGGRRHTWETRLFGPQDDVAFADRPVYGAWDLLRHRHGGSPAFGSCFLVLGDHVRERCTLTVGDSHVGPTDVGTFAAPEAVLAGLAEQAVAGDLLGRGGGVDELIDLLSGAGRPTADRSLDGYVELQVHGGVRLAEDVDAFVVDPSFRGTGPGDDLAAAAATHGAALRWHPGTSLDVALLDDEHALARLPNEVRGPEVRATLEAVASNDGRVDAARIGRIVADVTLPRRRRRGDPRDAPLQLVKRAWRTTYLLGRDTGPWTGVDA